MATNLYIEVANRKGINSPSDRNPIVPGDYSVPGTYQFNLYYLDYGNPDTYHRYQIAAMEINIRQNGPPTGGSFTLTFFGYTTDPIDASSPSADDVQQALEDLPSVRPGNIKVIGNSIAGFNVEFIGNRAGLAQQPITCDARSCSPASTAVVKQIGIGGINGSNSRQLIIISQARVATTNAFTELTAGSLWGWTTSVGLSTSGISQSFWQSPTYDIVLEVKLFIAGSRSGTDGITTQLSARSGSDGVVGDDGRGRSGTDGATSSSAGRSQAAVVYDSQFTTNTVNGYPFSRLLGLSANDANARYTIDDIGRGVTGNHIPAGATIVDLVVPDGTTDANENAKYKGAILSAGVTDILASPHYVNETVALGALVSKHYQSSGAAFTAADVGHAFSGTNIPAGTTILTFVSVSEVILSNNPTAAGSGLSWTITSLPSIKYTSATAAFTSADFGRAIAGTNVQSGTVIASVIDSQNVTLSKVPNALGTGLSWSMDAQMSAVYQSATANFITGDQGKILSGTNIPANTTIVSRIDASHVSLSQLPIAAGNGLSWQIIVTGPGSSGAPVVTDVQVGDANNPAIQQIAFAEVPDYGTFTLQDGAGGQPVTPVIPLPLDEAQITDALNTTYPAKQPFTVKKIADGIFQVTWGVTGAQSHLIVDDTNIIYDNLVLQLVLVSGSGTAGGGPGQVLPPIIYDGDFSREMACGPVREESIPNTGGAKMYRQRFIQLAANRRGRALNSGGPFGSFLIEATGCQDVGGGVVEWDYVWVTLPPNRTDPIFAPRTFQGTSWQLTSGTITDREIWGISVSQRMTRIRTYSVGYPGWNSGGTPAGIVIHFGSGTPTFIALGFNGFTFPNGTFYQIWNWSINIQRWMGDLWEMEIVRG